MINVIKRNWHCPQTSVFRSLCNVNNDLFPPITCVHIQKRFNATTAQPSTEAFPQKPKNHQYPTTQSMREYIHVHLLYLVFCDSETSKMITKKIIGLGLTNCRYCLLSIDFLVRALSAMAGYCFEQTWKNHSTVMVINSGMAGELRTLLPYPYTSPLSGVVMVNDK